MAVLDKINIIDNSIDQMKKVLSLPSSASLEEVVAAIGQGGSPTGPTNIYRVETEEDRDAIVGMVEGDICVVQKNTIANITATTEFQTAICPATVVLPAAFEGYADLRFSAVDPEQMFDCWGQLDSSYFMMDCYSEAGSVRIEYTSNDGITYTREYPSEDNIDFGTPIVYARPDSWNDVIGYFLQAGSISFGGIFTYSGGVWDYSKIGVSLTPDLLYVDKKAYTDAGEITGTLTTNATNTFDDTDARIYTELHASYDDMDVVVAPVDSLNLYKSKKLYLIPTKTDGTSLLDTSNTTNMESMFQGCSNLTEIALLDTSNSTSMARMFQDCSRLKTIPLLDTSKVTTMLSMFNSCTNFTTMPLLDTSKVTTMQGMFALCASLTDFPLLDIKSVTNTSYMFNGCKGLTEIPQLNTSSVVDTQYMFNNCTNLITIPLLDTSNVTNMYCMFYNCQSLTTVPVLNMTKVTKNTYMFSNCLSLSDDSLNNIMQSCINGTSLTSSNKTTKNLGFTTAQRERIKALPAYDSFIAAGWTNA